MFYDKQPKEQQEQYIKLLQAVGSISNLFSNNKTPYLYYRAAENIFCRALEAHDLSRGDISFDAFKGKTGIGLKTFVHGNGKKYEKIAEFNKDIEKFRHLDKKGIVDKIAELRNNRIAATERAHGTEDKIYHMVTRTDGKFQLYEEEMHYIDIDTLKLDTKRTTDKNIFFKDKYASYKFYIAKSTLYKQFICENPIIEFDVEILDNPFDFLLSKEKQKYYVGHEHEEQYDQVYLPLYSAQSGKVEAQSGLNQWAASGRLRHQDEVYIPIPAWIHQQFEGFFPYDRKTDKKNPFILVLPDGKELDAKVCQGGGKGFMTKPNRHLGHWILRTVLQVTPFVPVTYDDLDKAGIDSVLITKLEDYKFQINFAAKGSYKDFEEDYKK